MVGLKADESNVLVNFFRGKSLFFRWREALQPG